MRVVSIIAPLNTIADTAFAGQKCLDRIEPHRRANHANLR